MWLLTTFDSDEDIERAIQADAKAYSLKGVVFFGLIPAVQAKRADLVGGLKASDADRGRRHRIWGAMLWLPRRLPSRSCS